MANDGRRFAGTGSERQAAAVEALGVAVAAGVPVLLWGAPGTGKTSVGHPGDGRCPGVALRDRDRLHP